MLSGRRSDVPMTKEMLNIISVVNFMETVIVFQILIMLQCMEKRILEDYSDSLGGAEISGLTLKGNIDDAGEGYVFLGTLAGLYGWCKKFLIVYRK